MQDVNLSQTEVQDSLELWENKIQRNSKLLLGDKYICIQDTILSFVGDALASGFLDTFINQVANDLPITFSGSIGTFIVLAIKDLLNSIAKLDDSELCIYRQAVKNAKKHEEFTLKELKTWLPSENDLTCNLPDADCECRESGICKMCQREDLEEILSRLCDKKKVLSSKKVGDEIVYRFKR